MQQLTEAGKKTVGAKQSLKAIEKGSAKVVYVAGDADEKVRLPITELCRAKGIPLAEAYTMLELGRACGIQVGTAVAAILDQKE